MFSDRQNFRIFSLPGTVMTHFWSSLPSSLNTFGTDLLNLHCFCPFLLPPLACTVRNTHQDRCPCPRATTRRSFKDQTVTKSSSPPTTMYFESGLQHTHKKPPKYDRAIPINSNVSYKKTRRNPSCETIANIVPHGEKQNSLILQFSVLKTHLYNGFLEDFDLHVRIVKPSPVLKLW